MPIKVQCCCICGSTTLKPHDPELEGYEPGTEIGIVYGEELTGSYSWDALVYPIECDKGHIFYAPALSEGEFNA